MTDAADAFAKTISGLAFQLDPDRIGTGPLAELRRMDPMTAALPPAFWTTRFKHIPDDGCLGETQERAWAVILHGMAQLAPKPHQWGREHAVGAVLAQTGYSEQRFVRLLRAESEALAGEVGTVCRWLAAKGQAVDWVEFAAFILARLTKPDGKDAETRGHALSRAYFRVLTKAEAKSETNTSAQESAR